MSSLCELRSREEPSEYVALNPALRNLCIQDSGGSMAYDLS